ncbi:MAG: molybdopterin-dependent oxidoreductase, partial [Chromatiales bacterium]
MHADGTLVVVIDRAEMGQGVVTGLAMLAAEELGVGVDRIKAAFAPADDVYTNPMIGEQLTGGSTSVRGSWEPLRLAAAQAREVLVAAAAGLWRVSPGECRCTEGAVRHPGSGRSLSLGELVPEARELDPPRAPPVTPPLELRVIGTSPPRLEVPAMVRGRAVYGTDVRLPGMRSASVERCPFVGGRL